MSTELKQQIAQKLEIAFSQYGFAEPSVSKLQKSCDVSLRTLYKYYPSKEDMIAAALEFRHQRYLARLVSEPSMSGLAAINHCIEQLEDWMKNHAPNGCMSSLAIASFPENATIASVVSEHKQAVRRHLIELTGNTDTGNSLFLIHEGISATWPVLGSQSIDIAKAMITELVEV
ncbi:TetR/AcrR family transcriptional regulator [Vibrio sp. SCSIO 43135]|uniref:TetR/AcrR family transcriptional regulator n=1 Tax=Vibrio sp. SCSIO 43135 TaxID=2819096 RepID=UPI00207609EE|nr:TetR/AcrR family transcriptional regulator [Vibrio sp. SCSIO 43135]USD43281.1 TetR/AcrR family transcriptional regulator [Vibrio sp. SCSIO 43135]